MCPTTANLFSRFPFVFLRHRETPYGFYICIVIQKYYNRGSIWFQVDGKMCTMRTDNSLLSIFIKQSIEKKSWLSILKFHIRNTTEVFDYERLPLFCSEYLKAIRRRKKEITCRKRPIELIYLRVSNTFLTTIY